MAVLRSEIPVGYKTTIVRTIIQALRAAFTSAYPEAQFADLNIVNEFPLTEIEYPSIVVKYHERGIPNAGVGHVEYFDDPDGQLRKWFHRRFEGSLEFTVCALTPLDRDVLSNALVEVLAFGSLDALLKNFFIKVYGDIGVDVGVLGLLHQISLNTDLIQPNGESNNIAPWRPEDTMVYQNSYSCDCNGGFYNSPRSTSPLGLIETVYQFPYIDTTLGGTLPTDDHPDQQWSFVFDYDDDGSVVGKAVISSDEEYVPADATITIEPDVTAGSFNINNINTFITNDVPGAVYHATLGPVAIQGEQQAINFHTFGPYVQNYSGGSWHALGGALAASQPSQNGEMYPCITLDSTGAIVVAWYEKSGVFGGTLHVKRWNGASWDAIGTPLNTNVDATCLGLALCADNAGNLYLASIAGDVGTEIYVQKWNGASWAAFGSQPLPRAATILTGTAKPVAIICNPADSYRPTVMWAETGSPDRIRIAEWGGASWTGTSIVMASFEGTAIDPESVALTYDSRNSKLVFAVVLNTNTATEIHVWTGQHGSWAKWQTNQSVATNRAFSGTSCPIVFDTNGTPIISFWGVNSTFYGLDNIRYRAWSNGDGQWIDPVITNPVASSDTANSGEPPALAINGTDIWAVWTGRSQTSGTPKTWIKHGTIDDTN